MPSRPYNRAQVSKSVHTSTLQQISYGGLLEYTPQLPPPLLEGDIQYLTLSRKRLPRKRRARR